MSRQNSKLPLITVLIIVVIILSFFSLLIGPSKIPAVKVLTATFMPQDNNVSSIIWQIRMPKLFALLLAGASLACSGTILLGMTGHMLYDSAASYAVFGAGSVLAAMAVILIALGLPMNTALFDLLGYHLVITWSNVIFLVPIVLLGILISIIYSKDLNAMVFGEYTAKTLGVEVWKTRLLLTLVALILALASMKICGFSGLVWLLTPYLIRTMAGTNYKHLIPASMLAGMAVFVLLDIFSRLIYPAVLPLGIMMSLTGSILFLYASYRRKAGL